MRRTTLFLCSLSLSFIAVFGQLAHSQVSDPVLAASAPQPGSDHHYIGIGSETVNPVDGSLSFDLPIQTPAGRQLSFPFGIRYNSVENYYLAATNSGQFGWYSRLQSSPAEVNGWGYKLPLVAGSAHVQVAYSTYTGTPPQGQVNHQCDASTAFVFRGLASTQYNLPIANVYIDPQYDQSFNNTPACNQHYYAGGSAHGILSSGPSTWPSSSAQPPISVIDQAGTSYAFPSYSAGGLIASNPPASWGVLASTITDRNGNRISLSGNNSYIDTLGRTVVSWTGIGNNGDQVSVSGLSSPVVLHWSALSQPILQTNIQTISGSTYCSISGTGGYQYSVSGVTEIDLPNGQEYTLAYDATYENVSKVTFPNGGYVRYVWGKNPYSRSATSSPAWSTNYCTIAYDSPGITDRYVSYNGSSEVLHQHFAYSTTWGSSDWTSKSTTVTTTDLLTNQVSVTIYNYLPISVDTTPYTNGNSHAAVESNVVYQDGNGHTLKTVNKTWLDSYTMLGEQVILDDGVSATTTLRCYDTNEQVTDVYEYGFASEGSYPGDPTPSTGTTCGSKSGLNTAVLGPLRRHTVTAYHNFSGAAPSTHIVDAPDSVTVYDGSNTVAKQILYGYDERSVTGSGAATGLVGPPGLRGNATTVRKLIGGSNYLTQTYSYYDTGQMYTFTDGCGNTACSDMSGSNHTTTYSYSDNYTAATSPAPPGQTFGYLTQVTHPSTGSVAHIEKYSRGYNDGLVRSHVDENNLTTSYDYADELLRLTNVTGPDGGQTNIQYNDSGPSPSMTATGQINASQSETTVTIYDGIGHAVQTQLTSDPQGTVYADTGYDGIGRVRTQSNPYRNGGDPTSSPGTSIFAYDALGRKTSQTHPDGSVQTTAYCGASTLVTDPSGKWRRSRTDGLGFMVRVDEPNSSSASASACPGNSDPVWVTTYGYNALGDLISVLQNGTHSRSFSYDLASRMLTSNNPEVGQIAYTYDANSNLSTKQDARSLVVYYGYDVLNRLLSRSYSNGDPTVTIVYDQANCLGLGSCQNIGHQTSMTDAAGSEYWTYLTDYNNRRSVHVDQRTTNGVTRNTTYYLDLAGNPTQIVYPTGRTVNYAYNNANRPVSAVDASNGITYATAPASPLSGCPTSAVCYTPQGSIYSMSVGKAGSFTGLNVSESFNNRLQPKEISASSTAGSVLDIQYNFADPNGRNAGHLYGITNVLNSSRSQSFAYDQLNRLSSAGTTTTSGSYCWGYQYSYDTYGNLLSQTGWSPTYNACTEYQMSLAGADNGNHISTYSYDSSGNTLSDGINSYNWNSESQITAAAGIVYKYDGMGRRVSKSSGKMYWYGAGGEVLTETDSAGAMTAEYIFFAGRRVAAINTAGAQYYVEDMLGSSRVVTQSNGTLCYDGDFTPFGGERAYTNSCSNNYKFEGKERDSETQNDNFGARYYSWRSGRWLSSDWSALPVAVPYANLTNPQTLNLYSMVADDPESFADLDGHQAEKACGGDWTGYNPTTGTSSSGAVDSYAPGCAEQAQETTEKGMTAQKDTKAQQNNDKNTDVMLMSNHANPQYSGANNAGQVEVEWHIVPQANNISDPQLQQKSTDATAQKYSGASILLDESRRTKPEWHWEGSRTGSGLDHFDQSALPANQKWYINTGGGNNSSNQRIQVVIGMKPDGTLIKAWTAHVEWGRNGPVYSKID